MIDCKVIRVICRGNTWTDASAKLINSSRIEHGWISYAGVVLQA